MLCRVKVQENNQQSEDNKMLRTYSRWLNPEPYGGLLRVSLRVAYNNGANPQANFSTLPRLPVPKLEDTMAKFLRSVRPFLNDKEFAKTTSVVQDFQENWAPEMQAVLEKRAKDYDNWLEEWWLNNAYLDFRSSVVVASSPGLIMPFQKFKNQDEQLSYAAKILLATLDFKALVDKDKLPQEKSGKNLLDMGQYKRVFGTCRVPGMERDRLSYNPKTKYITVMHNNHIFHVDLFGKDTMRLNHQQIVEQLKKVVQQSKTRNDLGIGYLTSQTRDNWAKAYHSLIRDPVNRKSLLDVEKSIIVLCLDAPFGLWDLKDDDERRTIGGGQSIHGGGSKSNGGNRWYDKTIQVIVGADGLVGMSYEHSPAEGQPIAILADNIVKYIAKDQIESRPSKIVPEPELLKFNVTPEQEKMIHNAHHHLDKLVNNLSLNCFKFKDYGKNLMKSFKLSPDSYLQMAFQYTFYRLHKVPGAHYESAAVRMFKGGRTETIRSCSIESIKFAQTMLDPNSSAQEKVATMKAAIIGHRNYTIQALQGLGVDRHLLGLKMAAEQFSVPLHKLYTDPGYLRSGHMRISTSQVAFKADSLMCYGALTDNGYATCYNPRNDDVNFAASCYKSKSGTNVLDYSEALRQSLIDMKNVMQQSTPSKL